MASIRLLFSMLQGSFLVKPNSQNFCIASSHPTARLSLWFAAQKYPGTLETCSASSWDLQISPWTQFRDFSKLRRSDILIDQIHKSYLNGDTVINVVVESAYKIDGKGGRPYWNGALITQSAQHHLFWPGCLAFLGPEVVISGRGKNVEERASSATGPHP